MPEVCLYGDGLYGDGHYGQCDVGNLRGCSPAGADQSPLTVTVPFDPDCDQSEDCS